jgi:hypothetical protein
MESVFAIGGPEAATDELLAAISAEIAVLHNEIDVQVRIPQSAI